MSSRAKIRGFTGWANFRLLPTTKFMSNVLNELMTGSFFKAIVENMTGIESKKITAMDNLSAPQREMRVQWIIEELKAQRVLAKTAEFDCKCCAIPSPDHIFELLWRLVTYDIIFIWERFEYLMIEQDDILVKYKLNWIPDVPVRGPKKVKKKVNFLAGLGGASESIEVVESSATNEQQHFSVTLKIPKTNTNTPGDAELSDYADNNDVEPVEPFPSSADMKAFKKNRPDEVPSPKNCIFEIVNAILKAGGADQEELNDLVQIADVRILVPLINYFFGTVFTADVLLNDRWSMNLILRTAERLIRIDATAMKTEDIAEADKMATCSYLCAFFMLGFHYRQASAVLRVEAFFKDQMKSMQRQLGDLKVSGNSDEYFKKHVEYEKATEAIKKELDRLTTTFDIAAFKIWKKQVEKIKEGVYKDTVKAMERKFEIIKIPKTMTLNTFCVSHVVNLFLTSGVAFLLVENKQVVPLSTKLVIRKKSNDKFYENFSGNKELAGKLFKMLSVRPKDEVITLTPDSYGETMEVYMEFSGGNRRLTEGVSFLYQIFPSDFGMYIQQLLNAAKSGRNASVRTLLGFFSPAWPTFVDERDPKTGETALHAAAAVNAADMVELLLENYAKINVTNRHLETPLHLSMQNFQRQAAQTLAEWGCDLYVGNLRGDTPLSICKNGTLVNHITDWSQYCRMLSERIAVEHDSNYLLSVIKMHRSGEKPFVSLRSRVVAGSTLLHAAAFLGNMDAVKELLDVNVDPNVTDYKGATPLHCTTDFAIAKALLLTGANVSACDREGNTPLHLRSFGGLVVSANDNKNRNKKKEEPPAAENVGNIIEIASSSVGRTPAESAPEPVSGLEASREEPLNTRLLFLLFDFSADFTARNKKGLLPIHCAAIRGRQDIIEFLLQDSVDPMKLQQAALLEEGEMKSPSLTYLALAYGHTSCAVWLSNKAGFKLKDNEGDELLQKLLTQKMQLPELDATLKFILEQGIDANPLYVDGNSALHYAALLRETVNPIHLLASFGGDVNKRNSAGCTPLMFACKANNIFAAHALLSVGADPTILNMDGLGAFDVVPDLDEWIMSGMFDEHTVRSFEKHILKQGRLLVHAVSKRIDEHEIQNRMHTNSGRRHVPLKADAIYNDSREIIPANHYMTLSS